MAGGAGSSIGRGGMITKVLAAKRAAYGGASTVVCSGREADVLLRLAAGESVGTEFVAQTPRLAARKQWLADHLQLRGSVRLDAGAVRALRDDGKSLLPIGVVEVVGEFERGEINLIIERAALLGTAQMQDKLMELTDKAKSTKDLGAVAMGLTTMHNIKQISSGGPTEIKEHRHRFSVEDFEEARKRRQGGEETRRLEESTVLDVPVEMVKEMIRAE
jgi:glutamate 5-kinase